MIRSQKKGCGRMKTMKINDGENIIVSILFILFLIIILPIALLVLLWKFFAAPFDYIKYKRSRYQQDFPHKYSWLRATHVDNEAYTAIKENSLPVEYIKWSEDYNFFGYFVYKDMLLDFTEPFCFDEEEKLFFDSIDKNEMANDETEDDDNGDKRLTVEETKELILGRFCDNIPGRECNRIVFFYSGKNAKREYTEEGLEIMRTLDDFIIYEKGELSKAIKDFTDNN